MSVQQLRDMSNADLAAKLEKGGMWSDPNPHYVLEAARRLRNLEAEAKQEDEKREMNSVIINTAQTLLMDLAGMIREPIHNGMVEFLGRRYQLTFVIRQDAYDAMVAWTCRYAARPGNPYDTLFGLPLLVVHSNDAPMVSLRIEPNCGGEAAR